MWWSNVCASLDCVVCAACRSGHLLPDITSAPEFEGCKTAEDLPPAVRTGFLAFDAKTRDLPAIKSGADHSGSTAVTAFVTPTHYVVANCGACAWHVHCLPLAVRRRCPCYGWRDERDSPALCALVLQATRVVCCHVAMGEACGHPMTTSRRWCVVLSRLGVGPC